MASYQDTWIPNVRRPRKRPRQDLDWREATDTAAQPSIQNDGADATASHVDVEREGEQWLTICAEIGRRLARVEAISHEGLDAECRQAIRELQGDNGPGLLEQEAWEALGVGDRSEVVIAALCRAMAGERDAALLRVVRGFLMHVLRPRVLGLQAPASRVLAEGIEAIARQWPRALLDHLVLPLLLTGEDKGAASGWAQCEVCIRLIKKGALPQVCREQPPDCPHGSVHVFTLVCGGRPCVPLLHRRSWSTCLPLCVACRGRHPALVAAPWCGPTRPWAC